MHGFGDVGVFAEARAFQDPSLELEGGVVEVTREPRMFHELVELHAEMVRGSIARVIHQVHGSRTGHYVEGESQNENGGKDDEGDGVVLEPEVVNVNVMR